MAILRASRFLLNFRYSAPLLGTPISLALVATAAAFLAVAPAAEANHIRLGTSPSRLNTISLHAVEGTNTELYNEHETSSSALSLLAGAAGVSAEGYAFTGYRANRARVAVDDSSLTRFVFAQAISEWHDQIVLLGGPTNPVTLGLVFEISGALSADHSFGATASFGFEFDTEDECCNDSVSDAWLNPTVLSDHEILFLVEAELGVLIGITSRLVISASVGRDDLGTSLANFGATAILREVILPDGVTIESASGTNYMVPIPEPSTASLMGFGLLWMALGRTRRVRAGR